VEKEEVKKVLLKKIAMIERECQDVERTAGTSREEIEEQSTNSKDGKETAMTFLLGVTANSVHCTG